MKKYKKILFIIILIVIICGIVWIISNSTTKKETNKVKSTRSATQNSNQTSNEINENIDNNISQNTANETMVLEDNNKNETDNNSSNKTVEITPIAKIDIIMNDKTYITQINDIWANPDEYIGKTIQIEGFPLTSNDYTFVGKYGPGCCSGDGYAYMEYQYSEKLDLVDEEDWLKVTGTIRQGNDNGEIYMYIEAQSVEKLAIRGNDKVTM